MENDFRKDNEFYPMVTSLEQKRNKMNQRFQQEDYGEAINYARSLIESTCKYVYHELTGTEVAQVKGRKIEPTGEYYISLNGLISATIEKLSSLINYKKSIKEISDDLIDIVRRIGDIRNKSSVSHGSRTRNIEPQKEETLFVISLAEDVCIFLVKLLHARTSV
ncbi:MAG: abortive infection family protein [Lactobacillus sp.]|jgi:hypothetical protein|nr:abortive infection family protein [Lactobacillus sp.]MCH4068621.1 abortive infection family protein [Lactobacillus sp.]MCI1304084.1 abortive infection family protein [Lactobacillus sp.]MCI1330241.1 abortive infection family protein [Lactobacillus sp.]MCI1400137.1 abortive infection family protein [Lactobacillus sp.]